MLSPLIGQKHVFLHVGFLVSHRLYKGGKLLLSPLRHLLVDSLRGLLALALVVLLVEVILKGVHQEVVRLIVIVVHF